MPGFDSEALDFRAASESFAAVRRPCRLYRPDGVEQPPVLAHAHDGSFAGGSLPSWDAMLRELVRQSSVAVLSVDYRLAPEHRFPVAFD